MTDIERDTERRITTLESNMNNLIAEMRDFKAEMRDRDNQRVADIRELKEKQEAALREQRRKQAALDEKLTAAQKEFTAQLHSNFIQTMIGVGAIMVTVGGLIIAVLK